MTVTMATNGINTDDDKSSDGVKNYRAPSGAIVSAFRTKPVADLKAMFDNAGDKIGLSERSDNGTKTRLNASSPRKVVTRLEGSSHMASLNTAPASALKEGNNILKEDKTASKDSSLKIQTEDIEKLALKPGSRNMVDGAILKTCNGRHTCKADVELKNINCANDCCVNTETNAASVMSLGLMKFNMQSTITNDETNMHEARSVEKMASSGKSGIVQPCSSRIKKNENYVALHGVAKGGQTNVVKDKEHDSVDSKKTDGMFKESCVGKVIEHVKTASDNKIPGFRSICPENVGWNCNDASSGSSFGNLSSRSFKVSSSVDSEASASKCEDKTDVNANIQRFENNCTLVLTVKPSNNGKQTKNDLNSLDAVVAADSKSNVKQKDVDKDSKMFNRNSGSPISDSESGKQSPKLNGDLEYVEKSRVSLEEHKKKSKSLEKGYEKHQTLCRDSPTGPKRFVTRINSSEIRYHLGKSDFTEPALATQKNVEESLKTLSDIQELRHSECSVSSKLCTEKLQLIKKEFEINAAKKISELSTLKNMEIADIDVGISILERKQSIIKAEIQKQKFLEQKEKVSPRETSVTETIKTLNELDAKAKLEQMILCYRHRSLPSTSQENVSVKAKEDTHSLSGNSSGPNHQEVSANQNLDDGSDRDISSGSDLIYEVIQGEEEKDGMVSQKTCTDGVQTVQKIRKAREEQRKLAEFQTGTDSDIDSNTDSSCSYGIYEDIDQQPSQNDAILDSDSLEEVLVQVLPSRDSIKGKKKKDKKGIKDSFTKLSTGKTMDTKTGVKQVNGSKMPVSPHFGRSVAQNLQKTNSSSGSNLDSVSNVDASFINSDGPNTDNDMEQNSKKCGSEKSEEMSNEAQAIPPPLPPRHTLTNKAPSGGEMCKQPNVLESMSQSSSYHRAPPAEAVERPLSCLRLDRNLGRLLPLPPRNRILNKLDLNAVIPIHLGGDRRGGAQVPDNDSYLLGQLFEGPSSNNAFTNDATHSCNFISKNAAAPPLPTRPIFGARKSNSGVQLYTEIESPVDGMDYSLVDEIRKELEKLPESSSYINSQELTAVPIPCGGKLGKAPFEDVLHFYTQHDEDCLYVDLSDDQVYGTGRKYTSTLESFSLYQFYNKDKISRAKRQNAIYSSFEESDDEEVYDKKERVYEDLSEFNTEQKDLGVEKKVEEVDRTAKVLCLEMFGNTGTILRALWSEMPAVKNSGVLENITPQERKLQESMFEIITSEATYLKSLNVLMDMFVLSEEFGCKVLSSKCVITKQQQHVIFSNIGVIRDTSERLLSKLESRWQESVVLTDVCDIIAEFSAKDFECYVHYCSNQVFQDRKVTDLKKIPEFAEALKRIEAKPECQGLPMISFLLLPMQRITRLPLLVDAIYRRLDPNKDKERRMTALKAFHCISKVVRQCNNGAKKMQQTEQMYFVSKQIEFSANKEVAQLPLLSASRYLVKQGELVRITNETGSRIPFGKPKHGKQTVHVFLFSDLLVITKKKGDKFVVSDHAQRNSLHVEELNSLDIISRVLPLGVPGGCKYLFLLVMLENHDKKQVDNVFACNSECDRTRWVDAFTPVKVTDDQRIYEEWDCPQVQCIKKYVALEPDELSLEESDVVNVYKKLEEDGMYEGERMRDGERGWFPKNHTVEIENAHVRARNMRMKYRLQNAADMGSKTGCYHVP